MKKIANKFGDLNKLKSQLTLDQFLIGSGTIFTKKEILKFGKEREKLRSEKIKIENDLSYIEKIAREKYKMVKPGEKIFKVIDN